MFALPAFIAIIQTALLMSLYRYETPQYLIVNQNNEAQANEVLGKIYFEEDIQKIVQYIRSNNKEISGTVSLFVLRIFRKLKTLR